MSKKSDDLIERKAALTRLRKLLKPGTTVYTIMRSVSASGMTRRITLACINRNAYGKGKMGITTLDYTYEQLSGTRHNDRAGVVIHGCGEDMGFALVYNLGRILYPEGFKLPKGAYGRNGDTSGFDTDGGYALNHQWL